MVRRSPEAMVISISWPTSSPLSPAAATMVRRICGVQMPSSMEDLPSDCSRV